MKALVTGVAGFIGSHLAGTLLDARRRRSRDRTASRTTIRGRSRKRNLATVATHDRFRFVETSIQDADLDALLDGVTHVFHLAAQAGVRKSWGRDFRIYTTNNVDATQILLESVVEAADRAARLRLELVGLRRRRADSDAREALPHPLSPYGVTKLAAEQLCHLYAVNHGVPATARALLHRVWPSPAS